MDKPLRIGLIGAGFMGRMHSNVNMMADFFRSLESGGASCPEFRDAYRVQLVCDAVLESARRGSWVEVR